MSGTLRSSPISIEIIEFRADKFQLSKCNARTHTGFCVKEGEGEMCGRRT